MLKASWSASLSIKQPVVSPPPVAKVEFSHVGWFPSTWASDISNRSAFLSVRQPSVSPPAAAEVELSVDEVELFSTTQELDIPNGSVSVPIKQLSTSFSVDHIDMIFTSQMLDIHSESTKSPSIECAPQPTFSPDEMESLIAVLADFSLEVELFSTTQELDIPNGSTSVSVKQPTISFSVDHIDMISTSQMLDIRSESTESPSVECAPQPAFSPDEMESLLAALADMLSNDSMAALVPPAAKTPGFDMDAFIDWNACA
jgi:hypothetical protein